MLGAARERHRAYSRQGDIVELFARAVKHYGMVGSVNFVGGDKAVGGTAYARHHIFRFGDNGASGFGAKVAYGHCHQLVSRSTFGSENVDIVIVGSYHATFVVEACHYRTVLCIGGFKVFH